MAQHVSSKLCCAIAFVSLLASAKGVAQDSTVADTVMSRKTVGEFVGINGHFPFRPQLYRPVAGLVRNYHSIEWDLGNDSDFETTFPFARNKVNWSTVYGGWRAEGFDIDASLMFETIAARDWKDIERDAYRYGRAFAAALGPTHENLVQTVEIGNEPGKFSDREYRQMFQALAKGFRDGDSNLKIATCNLVVGPSHEYAKSVDCVEGLQDLYDFLNIHTYAQAEPWPTWRRSYPEDPNIPYLSDVQKLIDWRNEHARGKPIWITEFGWDSSTKTPDPNTEFARWVGVSDLQQAQYLVRSILIFMSMDVERAYIYYYDDSDQPSVHASSGVTRGFVPKPSYFALQQMQQILGSYRLARIQERSDKLYHFVLADRDGDSEVHVIWSPTGSGEKYATAISLGDAKTASVFVMQTTDATERAQQLTVIDGMLSLVAHESPTYVLVNQ